MLKLKQNYDWKVTVKKTLTMIAIVLVTGLISMWQNDVKYMALIPALTMTLNFLKHGLELKTE